MARHERLVTVIFTLAILLVIPALVLAGHTAATSVIFSNPAETVANQSQYAPGASYTFGITIENETFGGDTIDNSSVIFELGRPDGTFTNFTTSDTPNPFNQSTGRFNITFTQDQLGPVGDYNYTWYAATTATSDEVNASTTRVYTVAQNTTAGALLNLNSTFGDRTYESGEIAGQNAESNVTGLTVSIFNDLGGSEKLVGSGTTTANVTNDTTGLSGTFTVSANVTGNENYTASSTVSHTLTVGDNAAPSITLTLSDDSISKRGSVTVTCSATDGGSGVNSESVVVSKPSGESISINCGDTVSGDDTATSGTYTVEYIVSDASSNQVSKSATFTVSGGGGSFSGTAPQPRPKGTFVFQTIKAGTTEVMIVKDPDVGVQEMTVRVLNDANNVQLTVTKLEGRPVSITREIDGKVEKYLIIDTRNLPEESIDRAEIRFSVSKNWMSDNDVDRSQIRLFRYVGEEWMELDTEVTGEDGSDVFFTADTPGFSTFAVGAVEDEVTTEQPPEPVDEETPSEEESVTPQGEPVEAPADGNGTLIFIGLVVLALAVLAYEKWDKIMKGIRGKGSYAPR